MKALSDLGTPFRHLGTLVPSMDAAQFGLQGLQGLLGTAPPPETALSQERGLGACWPMLGQAGRLSVVLAHAAKITSVSIDHIQRRKAMNITSAPRRFRVYGYASIPVDEPTPTRGPRQRHRQHRDKDRHLLVEGEYDIEGGETQTFLLPPRGSLSGSMGGSLGTKKVEVEAEPEVEVVEEEKEEEEEEDTGRAARRKKRESRRKEKNKSKERMRHEIKADAVEEEGKGEGEAAPQAVVMVTLEILDNHGKEDYTCLYRFRVHGEEASISTTFST